MKLWESKGCLLKRKPAEFKSKGKRSSFAFYFC